MSYIGKLDNVLLEIRGKTYEYLKNLVPTWPEHVVMDMIYNLFGRTGGSPTNEAPDYIQRFTKSYGYNDPKEVIWKLESINIIPEIFEDEDWGMLKNRIAEVNKGMEVWGPESEKMKERYDTQAEIISSGPSNEPIILARFLNGKHELIEGWHRTIQSMAKWPRGYKQKAWVLISRT